MISLTPSVKLQGFYRFQVRRTDGTVRYDTGFFPNVILNTGLNHLGNNNMMTTCHVGTDNTVPNANQSGLLGKFATTSNIIQTNGGVQSITPPYYGWRRRIWRFPQGSVNANLTEVGVGFDATDNSLISRAFILDPVLQTPTTISPLIDELLDVTYELRYYIPTNDTVGPQVVIDGETYNSIVRPAEISSEYWYNWIGDAPVAYTGINNNHAYYDGDIGTQFQVPNGLNEWGGSDNRLSSGSYLNNSLQRLLSLQILEGNGNSWPVRSVLTRTKMGSWQTQFDRVSAPGTGIGKTLDFILTLNWYLSWAAR